jgi:hypothetical protein
MSVGQPEAHSGLRTFTLSLNIAISVLDAKGAFVPRQEIMDTAKETGANWKNGEPGGVGIYFVDHCVVIVSMPKEYEDLGVVQATLAGTPSDVEPLYSHFVSMMRKR